MAASDILIVEDEALIAVDIEMTLQGAGHRRISVHASAETALAEIERDPPRIAVLDVNLGEGRTSAPVAHRLRELDRPFMFLSAYTDETGALPKGLPDAVRLAKPFSARELTRMVDTLLATDPRG